MPSVGLIVFLGALTIAAILGIAGFGISLNARTHASSLDAQLHEAKMQLMILQLTTTQMQGANETVISSGACTNGGGSSAPYQLIAVDRGSYKSLVIEISPFVDVQVGNIVQIECVIPDNLEQLSATNGGDQLFTNSQLANITVTPSNQVPLYLTIPYPNYHTEFVVTTFPSIVTKVVLSWEFVSSPFETAQEWNIIAPTRFGLYSVFQG